MAVKLLVSGLSNSGKTTLTKTLENSLVISHDGKRYPFQIPHRLVRDFETAEELIATTSEAIEAYNTKFGEYPETVVFDSVSRIFDTIYDNCNRKYTGYTIYSTLDKEIKEVTSFIEDSIVGSNINVVILSHAIYDADTATYNLVGKGSFAKTGSFLSVVDEAIFLEPKANKRILHFRSTKFPARTLQEDLPDSTPVEEFDLQQHITMLAANQASADEFAL